MSDITKQLEYLNETKSILKGAIINKGQAIDDTLPFRNYADKIQNIETGMLSQDEYDTSVYITRNILGGSDRPSEIIASFDTYCNIDKSEKIGTHSKETSLVVLTYDVDGYDTSTLLTFDISQYVINPNIIDRVVLSAYYFNNDIPSRIQMHPVRRMVQSWTNDTILTYNHMATYIEGEMSQVSGYGWRTCDVTSLFKYWLSNPTRNYGLVIDNTRNASSGGGYWANMQYYSTEYSNGLYAPKLTITYKDGGEI